MTVDVSTNMNLTTAQSVSADTFLTAIARGYDALALWLKGDPELEASIRELQNFTDAQLSEMGIARSHIRDIVLNGRM